ncbi:AraC family transcriptional regulator [Paenibacillus chitinolyticus]|uniref:AraC family transcriptional regulator n=1 Tax=Paenibacillus chitinolyticus TaxID=79263 RepID=UPI00295EEB7B|nr:AraC family transcriptional regulator [Paenibacillus chitinolyticus]
MEIYNEQINYENPFLSMRVFQARRDDERTSPWHYHKEVEMLAIVEGELDVYLENERVNLKAGDVVLIGSSELHRDRSSADTTLVYYVFQFDLEHYFDESGIAYLRYFSETQSALSKLNYIFRENPAIRDEVFACIRNIYTEYAGKKVGYEIAISILVKQIVLSLLRSDEKRLLDYGNSADLIRLKPVFEYIDRNIDGKVYVDEASKAANISYYYFVKYFKKVLGISFLDYVNFKKIKKAEKILLTQDISVAQVGEQIGMPNMAHFYKTFKKINHCSPHEFRKKMLEWNR